jgi:hypothetical protein
MSVHSGNQLKIFFQKAVNALISPAGAASMQPNIVGYQPNVPLNAQAARLGAKGKAFLQAMAGEFGALEGKYGLPAGLLSSVAATESGGDPFAESSWSQRLVPVHARHGKGYGAQRS